MNPPLLLRFLIATSALATYAGAAELPAWLDGDAKKIQPGVIALRRDFHENPELSNGEERTSRVVAERLRALGLEVKTGVARHGVVALLRGGKPGPCVAVRADMDALPIEEAGALPFKSRQPGVMHACGHDAHTAVALGVAELLASHRAEIAGSVKFLFQPAEEGMPVRYAASWGAKLMIEEGALENPAPVAVFGLHCAPRIIATGGGPDAERSLPAGMLAYGFGSVYANSDSFTIDIRGKMAHGSTPHRGIDAIMVAASVLTELQTIRSRQINSQTPMVLTVGTIKGGQRSNILADHVEMSGTVRTLDAKTQARAEALMEQIVKNTAAAQGATAELNYRKGYPSVVNDAALAARALPILQQIVGKENVVEKLPSMGGEDFAFFAQKVPGFYFNLGVARPDDPDPAGAHTPEFHVDESALLTGVRAITALVWMTLAK